MKYRVTIPFKQKTIIYFNEVKQWAFSKKQFNDYMRDKNLYPDSADLRDIASRQRKTEMWENIFAAQYHEKEVNILIEYEP